MSSVEHKRIYLEKNVSVFETIKVNGVHSSFKWTMPLILRIRESEKLSCKTKWLFLMFKLATKMLQNCRNHPFEIWKANSDLDSCIKSRRQAEQLVRTYVVYLLRCWETRFNKCQLNVNRLTRLHQLLSSELYFVPNHCAAISGTISNAWMAHCKMKIMECCNLLVKNLFYI